MYSNATQPPPAPAQWRISVQLFNYYARQIGKKKIPGVNFLYKLVTQQRVSLVFYCWHLTEVKSELQINDVIYI